MTSAFPIARLQDVKAIVFNRELEVLHVLEMLFQNRADLHQLFMCSRHFLRKIGNRMGRAHARDDIFTLRVDQIFAVKNFFAAGRVARERHAGRARLPHVAKHHGLHTHRLAPIVGNPVFSAVHNRAIVHPRTEHGTNCAPQLFVRLLRKRFSRALFDQRFETLDQLSQVGHGQLHVRKVVFPVALVFQMLDHAFERFVIFSRAFLHTHHHVAIHLQKASIRVPGKTGVARFLRHDRDHLVVHSKI